MNNVEMNSYIESHNKSDFIKLIESQIIRIGLVFRNYLTHDLINDFLDKYEKFYILSTKQPKVFDFKNRFGEINGLNNLNNKKLFNIYLANDLVLDILVKNYLIEEYKDINLNELEIKLIDKFKNEKHDTSLHQKLQEYFSPYLHKIYGEQFN